MLIMIRTVFVFLMVFMASMKIQAHVELKYPVGGETHYPGETVNIVWDETVSHSTLNWDLFYSVDGGLTWTILKEDVAIEARNYQWIVPDVSTLKARISPSYLRQVFRILLSTLMSEYFPIL